MAMVMHVHASGIALRRLALELAFDTEPPQPDYVIGGLGAGVIGAIVAPGGTGKSIVLMQCAAGVAAAIDIAGGAFPRPTVPGKVVIFAGEDHEVEQRRRWHALYESLKKSQPPETPSQHVLDYIRHMLIKNVAVYSLAGLSCHIMDADGNATMSLREISELCKEARLVIIDPIRRFHTADENSSSPMTEFVKLLEGISKEHGCAILLSHHTNKAARDGAAGDQQAIRGSSAFTDAIRWQVNLLPMSPKQAAENGIASDKRDSYVVMNGAKSNNTKLLGQSILKRDENGILHLTDPSQKTATHYSTVLQGASPPPKQVKRQAAKAGVQYDNE